VPIYIPARVERGTVSVVSRPRTQLSDRWPWLEPGLMIPIVTC